VPSKMTAGNNWKSDEKGRPERRPGALYSRRIIALAAWSMDAESRCIGHRLGGQFEHDGQPRGRRRRRANCECLDRKAPGLQQAPLTEAFVKSDACGSARATTLYGFLCWGCAELKFRSHKLPESVQRRCSPRHKVNVNVFVPSGT
jgi:hypothetical protein